MADFIDPIVTNRIIAATDKLEAQADRAETLIDNLSDITVSSVNGQVGVVVLDTDDIPEGDTNKYFPEAPMTGLQYARQSGAWTVVTGGGGGGAAFWGGITGTLAHQTDLQDALDDKADIDDVTASSIKTKYESNPDTNAFTDDEKSKLAGIAEGARKGITSINGRSPSSGIVELDLEDIPETSWVKHFGVEDKMKLNGIAAGAQVNVATNLAQGTRTTTTVPITSSTGTGATLSAASTSLAGVMTSADKTKLDGIATGAQVNTVSTVFGRTGAITAVAGDYTSAQVSAAASATNYTPTAATVAGHLAGIDTALASGGGGGNPYNVVNTATYTSFQDFTTIDALGSGVYRVNTNTSDNTGFLPFKTGVQKLLVKVYKLDSSTYELEATVCTSTGYNSAGDSWRRVVTSTPSDSGWYNPSYVVPRVTTTLANRWDTFANIGTSILNGYAKPGKNIVKGGADVGMPLDSSDFLVELTKVVNSAGSTTAYHMVAWNLPTAPSAVLVKQQWVRHLSSSTDSGWQQISGT